MLSEKPVVSICSAVDGYLPKTKTKPSTKVLLEEDGIALAYSVSYERTGDFLKALLIDYRYFTINGVYRLGWLTEALMAPYNPKNRPRFKTSYLMFLWTDLLTEIDSLYNCRKAPMTVIDSKRVATDQYLRISKLLQWLRTEKTYLLKKGTSKDLVPILSEYVMNAGIRLSTLQSNFQLVVKK